MRHQASHRGALAEEEEEDRMAAAGDEAADAQFENEVKMKLDVLKVKYRGMDAASLGFWALSWTSQQRNWAGHYVGMTTPPDGSAFFYRMSLKIICVV